MHVLRGGTPFHLMYRVWCPEMTLGPLCGGDFLGRCHMYICMSTFYKQGICRSRRFRPLHPVFTAASFPSLTLWARRAARVV